jgi:hypothetical protein
MCVFDFPAFHCAFFFFKEIEKPADEQKAGKEGKKEESGGLKSGD